MEHETEEEFEEKDEEMKSSLIEEEPEDYVELNEEESIYSGEVSAKLLDDDELSPEEEAFMKGYTEE
jgi:hypothetical protein